MDSVPPAGRFPAHAAVWPYLVTALTAAATFWVAFDKGTFAAVDRYAVTIGIWWALLVGVVLMLWPAERVPRAAVAGGAVLAAYGLFTLWSITWALGTEAAFDDADRVATYLGAFVLAVAVGTRRNVVRLLDGVGLGIAAIVLLALAARLFPDWIEAARPRGAFQGDPRPSWPLGYWNGLAALAGLGLPLLVRLAVVSPTRLLRGAAIAPLPAFAALIYLTSSRTGTITAAVALLAFVVFTSQRARAAGAAGAVVLGSVVAVGLLASQSTIVNDPLSPDAGSEGRFAALAILVVCVVTAVGYGLASSATVRLPRPSRRTTRRVLAAVGVLLLVAVVAADPGKRFEDFKEPPPAIGTTDPEGYTANHLSSTGSSGRWQLWAAGVDEWKEHPVFGDGAGSYEGFWTEHGDLAHFVRSPHSLYLDALAELGLVGLALLLALLAVAGVAARRRLSGADEPERTTVAAVAAVALAFAIGVGVDWTWDLTALPIVGLFVVGLLLGPATATAEIATTPRAPGPPPSRRAALLSAWPRVAFALAALAIVAAQLMPLVGQTRVRNSQEAAARGDTASAVDDARGARSWQPWASSVHLQLALAHEKEGDLAGARSAIADAIERDRDDWRLWLVAARIETTAGATREARARFDRARELNPRSKLLAALPRP